jgi:hypothetical protein
VCLLSEEDPTLGRTGWHRRPWLPQMAFMPLTDTRQPDILHRSPGP